MPEKRLRDKREHPKAVPKRTLLRQKAAYILKPFVAYMAVKTAAMLLPAIGVSAFSEAGTAEWVKQNVYRISAVVNAAASIAAVCFVLKDFLKEVDVYGEVDIDAGMAGQFLVFLKKGFWGRGKVNAAGLAGSAVCGVLSASALNVTIEYVLRALRAGSARYGQVEAVQYSVPLWLGLILYGIVSPMVEEIVFRGVVYNRMKRFYSFPRCALLSALLFGAFHANLPQFVYGTCMGILIALSYEKAECFGAPVIFHMAANVSVFLAAVL